MSIEALKQQARRHEQEEDWIKALDQYKRAIAQLEADDQPDIGLYNRVGDLFVRVGNLGEAVSHYNKSVDLYLEAELANNAIGVCKKIIRNVPEQHEAFLRMGQIRARQGFLPDARTNFLTYAERMQQAGDLDESFRALVEFCDLAPEDVDVRIAVAEQMVAHDRARDAVDQLGVAYGVLMSGEDGRASEVGARIRVLDPHADLTRFVAAPQGDGGLAGAFVAGSGVQDDDETLGGFGEIEIGAGVGGAEEALEEVGTLDIGGFSLDTGTDADEEPAFELPTLDLGEGEGEPEPLPMFGLEDDEAEAEPLPGFDLGEDEEEAAPLPTFDLGEDEEEAEPLPELDLGEGEEEAEPLPILGFGEDEEEAEPLPTFDLGEDEEEAEPLPTLDLGEDEEDAEPLPIIDIADDETEPTAAARAMEAAVEEAASKVRTREAEGAPELTLDGVRNAIKAAPEDLDLRQRMVELAYQAGGEDALVEAFLGLGETLQGDGQAARAKVAFQQALQFDPENQQAKAALGQAPAAAKPVKEVAAHQDYVDLGALILGDDDEKTTRFVVAYEEPSGDEAADFAKMLSQFKEKVSQNLDADDVRAHYDLGTAYKEMGLLDEAVAEFQQALRASASHLPTYEMLGQTFIEMGKGEAAIRTMERALSVDYDIEDELIAIYYYLARAYETQGNKESALEFYDRVFTLDINFADVTERLRALR